MKGSAETESPIQKAVVYCRVSSAAQVSKGHGLESQETRCREFAKLKGYEVDAVFQDAAVSGGIVDRPGILDMLAHLKKHRKRHSYSVIIDDISRIARDIEAHLQLRRAISNAGASLESPSIEFGEDSDSILVENLLASVSQHQRQKNAEQTKNRMRARMMNGYSVQRVPPPGYRYEKREGQGKMLVRDEPLASIVQNALEGFASGLFGSQAEVTRFLASHQAFPKTRHGTVTNETTNRILNRVLYAGYVEAPDWGVALRPGKHEGLVSLETFERIQQRLKEGAKAPARTDICADFPLRGFVHCADCERPMTANWSKSKTGARHPYYMCFTKGCESYRKSIRRDRMEGEFETLLSGVRPTRSLFDMAKSMFKDAWNSQLTQAKNLAAAARNEIAGLEKQIDGLLDRIVDASSPSVINAYEKRIAKLEREKLIAAERSQPHGKPLRPFEEMFELSMQFLSNPCDIWASEHLESKRTVLKLSFLDGLVYSRNEGFRTPQLTVPFALFGNPADFGAMAEREGFEPSIRLPVYTRSRRAPSTTRPPLLNEPPEYTGPAPGCKRCRRGYQQEQRQRAPAPVRRYADQMRLRSDWRRFGDRVGIGVQIGDKIRVELQAGGQHRQIAALGDAVRIDRQQRGRIDLDSLFGRLGGSGDRIDVERPGKLLLDESAVL